MESLKKGIFEGRLQGWKEAILLCYKEAFGTPRPATFVNIQKIPDIEGCKNFFHILMNCSLHEIEDFLEKTYK